MLNTHSHSATVRSGSVSSEHTLRQLQLAAPVCSWLRLSVCVLPRVAPGRFVTPPRQASSSERHFLGESLLRGGKVHRAKPALIAVVNAKMPYDECSIVMLLKPLADRSQYMCRMFPSQWYVSGQAMANFAGVTSIG